MYETEITLRVRYAETDQMGHVYYGNYATYYEVGRVEALRKIGFSYKLLEEEGVHMPVLSLEIDYLRPACYDDLLRLQVQIPDMPQARINFSYMLFRDETLLSRATTRLAFVSVKTGRPLRLPSQLASLLSPYFPQNEAQSS